MKMKPHVEKLHICVILSTNKQSSIHFPQEIFKSYAAHLEAIEPVAILHKEFDVFDISFTKWTISHDEFGINDSLSVIHERLLIFKWLKRSLPVFLPWEIYKM